MEHKEIEQRDAGRTINIKTHNLGGLRGDIEVDLKPGLLNIIEAPNATGKTSLLNGFVLGVLPDREAVQYSHILHSHEKEGSVDLTYNNTHYSRIIFREGREIRLRGSVPEAAGLIRLFAIADTENPILEAVRSGGVLGNILIRYTNIEQLHDRRRKVLSDVERTESAIRQIRSDQDILDRMQNEQQVRVDKLEKLKAHRTDLSDRIAAVKKDKKVSKTLTLGQEVAKLDGDLAALDDEIKSLNAVKRSSENKLRSYQKAGITKPDKNDIDLKERALGKIQQDKQVLLGQQDLLSWRLEQLRSLMSLSSKLSLKDDGKLDALVGSKVSCPICNSSTSLEEIKANLKRVQNEFMDISTKVYNMDADHKQTASELSELQKALDNYINIQQDSDATLSTISHTEDMLAEKGKLKDKLQDLLKAKRTLYNTVIKKEIDESSKTEQELITAERQIAVIEVAVARGETDLKNLKNQLSRLAELNQELAAAKERGSSISAEIDKFEKEMISRFNIEISKVYELMKFRNVDAIKIDPAYKISVVRRGDRGGYIDPSGVMSLSKTEREMVGLVFVISGYIVHGLAKVYPLFVVDEVSYMDSERLNTFVDYVRAVVETLIIATVPSRGSTIENANMVKI